MALTEVSCPGRWRPWSLHLSRRGPHAHRHPTTILGRSWGRGEGWHVILPLRLTPPHHHHHHPQDASPGEQGQSATQASRLTGPSHLLWGSHSGLVPLRACSSSQRRPRPWESSREGRDARRRGQARPDPRATCLLHLRMSRCPGRAGVGPQKTPRDNREQVHGQYRHPVPREGGLVPPERRGEGSPGVCSAWDVLLRYARTPHQKPKGRHTGSPSTPVEPRPLGKLGWLLGPPWAFFESQRAEGDARLSWAASFLGPQCHQAESFSAPACGPLGVWSKPGKACGGRRGGSGAPRAFVPGPVAGPRGRAAA